MNTYRLLSTRRNHDGSFDVPSFDLPLSAPDDQAAIVMARRSPPDISGDTDVVWLVAPDGRVVWSNDRPLPRAA